MKSTGILSLGILTSRVLGFIRDMVLAHILGTGFRADAFFVALRIPNMFRELVAEGATETEVARAIALIETELTVALQSAGDRADKLSMFATYFGDPSLVNMQAEQYRAVTAERVNTYIQAHLKPENRASLLYVPREPVHAPLQDDLAMAEAP